VALTQICHFAEIDLSLSCLQLFFNWPSCRFSLKTT
jgi:hypothetical protein